MIKRKITMQKTPVYKHKTRRPFLLLLLISGLIVICAAAFVYFILSKPKDPTTSYRPEYPQSTENQPNTNTGQDSTNKQPPSADPTKPTISEKVPVAQTGTITIVNLNQRDGFVNALASVSDFTVSTCVYSFTSDGARPVVREQKGSCTGLSIPQVEFEKIGTYTLTVTAYGSTEKLTTSKTIEIE